MNSIIENLIGYPFLSFIYFYILVFNNVCVCYRMSKLIFQFSKKIEYKNTYSILKNSFKKFIFKIKKNIFFKAKTNITYNLSYYNVYLVIFLFNVLDNVFFFFTFFINFLKFLFFHTIFLFSSLSLFYIKLFFSTILFSLT